MSEEALAPTLAGLLDVGQRCVATLLGRTQDSVADLGASLELASASARSFLQGIARELQRVGLTVDPQDERGHLLDELRRALDQSSSTIDALLDAAASRNLPIVQSAVGSLEACFSNLQNCARSLDTLDRELPAALPFPALEALVAGLASWRSGLTNPESIQPLLVAAVALVARLDRQIALFETANQKAAPEARQLNQSLAAALGAIAEGLDDPAHLKPGLDTIAQVAWPLAGALRELERMSNASRSFSRYAPLEDCYRYVSRQSEVDPAARETLNRAAVERVELLYQLFQDQYDVLRSLPMSFTISLEPARAALQDLRHQVAQFQHAVGLADANSMLALCTLRDSVETTRSAIATARQELQAGLDLTADLPNLELLRERIGRLLQGTVSLKRFLVDFSGLATSLESLRNQIRTNPALASLLEQQRQGFERISRYFQDPDPTHLTEGWQTVARTLPGLQAVRRTLPEQALRPRGLAETMPDLLIKLTDWRSNLSPGDLRSRLREETRRLQDLRNEARNRFAHLLKATPSGAVHQAMQGYLDNITQLIDGLEMMQSGLDEGFERARSAIMAMELEVHQLAG